MMRTTIEPSAPAVKTDPVRFRIETIEDYELATQRIVMLDSADRGDDEDCERDALIEAVARWDREHDDATGWKDRP